MSTLLAEREARWRRRKRRRKLKSWEGIRAERALDDRAVAAYERLMEAEALVYELWERHGTGMNWIGEARPSSDAYFRGKAQARAGPVDAL